MGVFHHFGDPVGPAIPRAREDREGRKLRVRENSSSQGDRKKSRASSQTGRRAGWLVRPPETCSECWFTEHPVCPGGAPPGHGPPTGPTASPGTPRPCRSLGRLVRATRPASGHTDLPLGASFMVCVMRVSTFIGTLLKKSPRFGGHYWLSLFCFMNGGCGDQWR